MDGISANELFQASAFLKKIRAHRFLAKRKAIVTGGLGGIVSPHPTPPHPTPQPPNNFAFFFV